MSIISMSEKAQGALLSAAIGDALGWPNEFNSGNQRTCYDNDYRFVTWQRKNRYPFWHTETIERGSYSDDTQLTLAVARCLLYEDWQERFTKEEFPFWLEYERGAGRAVKKAASLWKKREIPWKSIENCKDYYMAGGNGGAMRILPHIIKRTNDSIENITIDVISNVIISHGHPRAILGATCYAYALYYLFHKTDVLSFAELVDVLIEGRKIWGAAPDKNVFAEWLEVAQDKSGFNYSKEWNGCYSSMINNFENIKNALNNGLLSDDKNVLEEIGAYSRVSGAGDVTILAAVYFFSKYANTPELAIGIPAFSKGIDTDTIASMVGGMIGAFYGSNWIPLEWRNVQDYTYICSVAGWLCSNEKNRNNNMSFTDIKRMKVLDIEEIESKYSVIKIAKYQSSLGQTIFIKSIEKKNNVIIENKASKSKEDENIIKLNSFDIEFILKESDLSRITLRKALQIIMLKSQGMTNDVIAKKLKVDIKIVVKVLDQLTA